MLTWTAPTTGMSKSNGMRVVLKRPFREMSDTPTCTIRISLGVCQQYKHNCTGVLAICMTVPCPNDVSMDHLCNNRGHLCRAAALEVNDEL